MATYADLRYRLCHVTALSEEFNCRFNPTMDYAFCLLILKSSRKWRLLLFGATCKLYRLF